MTTSAPDVAALLGSLAAVILATVAGCYAAWWGWRTHNWLAHIVAAGCALFVSGLIGQRTFPSPQAIAQLGTDAAGNSAPGPWDAGVSLPLIPVRLTPVSIAGLLILLAGLALVLFFERVGDQSRPEPAPMPLQDADSI